MRGDVPVSFVRVSADVREGRRRGGTRSVVAALAALAACDPPPADGPAPIAWADLTNPVVEDPDVAIKDAYAVRTDAGWRLGFSRIADDPFRFRFGTAATADFADVAFGDVYDDDAVGGLASPDATRRAGAYVVTYNSHTRDVGDAANKLYFRTSTDAADWSDGVRIVVDGVDAPEERLIDAALAHAEAGTFLFFKREQEAHVAFTTGDDLAGPYTLIGALDPPNLENLQAIRIDDAWHLVGTTLPLEHRPAIYRLDGDERDPQAWRTWTLAHEPLIPEEEWNSGPFPGSERANAAYLIDDRAVDGFFYLLYAGSTELDAFAGRGHAKLGLARSADLDQWTVP